MLAERPRILDFDGSVVRQKGFIENAKPDIIDLRSLGPMLRHWASSNSLRDLVTELGKGDRSAVTYIGSGDYHHISSLLLRQFEQPLSLIIFDHHPDWDRLPPRWGCGAWVNRALEQSNVGQILHVGAASRDFSWPQRMTGNYAAVKQGRLRLLPASSKKTFPLSLRSYIDSDLTQSPLETFSAGLDCLTSGAVYVSIDKDCLCREDALTNWEEGSLGLDQLIEFLARIRRRFDVVGVDITGDYSMPVHSSVWKKSCAWLDHPRDFTGAAASEEVIDVTNGRTNLQLWSALVNG